MVAGVPERQCSACAYWEACGRFTSGDISGRCRRFPPQRLIIPGWRALFGLADHITNNEFPVTKPESWCGEWSPRIEG